MNLRPITAEDVRVMRERGMGIHEAKELLKKQRLNEALDSPFWFLNLRGFIRHLINR